MNLRPRPYVRICNEPRCDAAGTWFYQCHKCESYEHYTTWRRAMLALMEHLRGRHT